MAYIGKSIESGTFSVLDTSGNTYNGSNTTFNLGTQVGSTAQLLVSHDGVIQKPGTDYTLASGGTQITFTTAPASGASIFIVEISGAVGGPLDADLNGTELILDTDGDTSITADTDDQIDIKIAGADDFQFTANTFTAASGSTIAAQALTATTLTATGAVSLNGGSFVFNEDSADVDFRVESNGNANMLTVNGGGDRVGIGADPDLGVGLHIKSADSGASVDAASDELVVEGSGSSGMTILSGTSGEGGIKFGNSSDNDAGRIVYDHNTDNMFFMTGGTERLRILDTGYIRALGVYNQSAGDSANVVVDGSGNIYRSTSALKYKKDVKDLESIDISSFRPVRYKSKSPKDDPNKEFIGFIADEFHNAGLKELVFYGKDNEVEGFNYDRLTVILTKALQEANAKIATLETKVKALEG